jgi:hypothetical protein
MEMEMRTRRIEARTKKVQGTRPFSRGQQLYEVTPRDTLWYQISLKGVFLIRSSAAPAKKYDISV